LNFEGSFHPEDLKRIHSDVWLENFLIFHDYNVKEAFIQCWETLEWRKNYDVNGKVKLENIKNGSTLFTE
jgi:hypothetical protein